MHLLRALLLNASLFWCSDACSVLSLFCIDLNILSLSLNLSYQTGDQCPCLNVLSVIAIAWQRPVGENVTDSKEVVEIMILVL